MKYFKKAIILVFTLIIHFTHLYAQSTDNQQVLDDTRSYMSNLISNRAKLIQLLHVLKTAYSTRNYNLYISHISKHSLSNLNHFNDLLINGDSTQLNDPSLPLSQKIGIMIIRCQPKVDKDNAIKLFKTELIRKIFDVLCANKQFMKNFPSANNLTIDDYTASSPPFNFRLEDNKWRLEDFSLTSFCDNGYLKALNEEKAKVLNSGGSYSKSDNEIMINALSKVFNKDCSEIVWQPIR